jgi:hypothetical protein
MLLEDNKDQKVLINFYVDKATRDRFDAICRASGKTRTQVLVALMKEHIIRSKPILEAQFEKLKEADNLLAAIRNYGDQVNDRVQEAEAEMPPTLFWSDGRDEVPYF